MKSLGHVGCILEVDSADDTVKVNVQHVAKVWFGFGALQKQLAFDDLRPGFTVRVKRDQNKIINGFTSVGIVAIFTRKMNRFSPSNAL